MSKKQNRLYRYVGLGLVTLAYVLGAYFVNQIPPLESLPLLGPLLKDVPPMVLGFAALVFGLIALVGPELLNVGEISSEELWRKFWAKNQDTINQRLKNSLDLGCHIDLNTKHSPTDLERPTPKKPKSQVSSGNNLENLFKGFQDWVKGFESVPVLSEIIATKPRIEALRELQNLQTQEITKLAPSKSILEIFEEANRRLLILGEPGSGKTIATCLSLTLVYFVLLFKLIIEVLTSL